MTIHMLSKFKSTLLVFLISFLLINQVFAAPKNMGALFQISDKHQLAVATAEGYNDLDKLADAITVLLNSAPRDKEIILAFEPNIHNASFYKNLYALIADTAEKVKKERNVRLNAQFISPELTAVVRSTLNELPTAQQPHYVRISEGNEQSGLLIAEEVPKNLVEKIKRRSSITNSLLYSVKDTSYAVVDAFKQTKFSGAVFATLATITGAATLGPTWIYVSDGNMTKESLMSFALSMSLLYTIPRNEALTKKVYELGYEFTRTGIQIGRYIRSKVKPFSYDEGFYVSEPSKLGRMTYNTLAATALFSMPLQMAFYGLQDGSAIWNPEYLQFMFRNALLIGAASGPWTYVTDKLKTETHLSKNLITHLRSAQLLGIGYLSVSIPYGIEAKFFNINSIEEALLLASGALGIAANKYAVAIINKLDKNVTYRWLNKNLEALMNAPANLVINIVRKISGKRPIDFQFQTREGMRYEINHGNYVGIKTCKGYLE